LNATQCFLGNPATWNAVQVHLSIMQALFGGWYVHVFGEGEGIVLRLSRMMQEQRYRLAFSGDAARVLREPCIASDLSPSHRPATPVTLTRP